MRGKLGGGVGQRTNQGESLRSSVRSGRGGVQTGEPAQTQAPPDEESSIWARNDDAREHDRHLRYSGGINLVAVEAHASNKLRD